MTSKSGRRAARLMSTTFLMGTVVLVAACVPTPAPPTDTSTTTTPSTTTTTLPACTATSISPNPIPTPAGASVNVSLCYAGFPSTTRLFITQCDKSPSDATFDPQGDCSTFSELTVNPSDNATGTGRVTFPVFHGAEPSGDDIWGCFKAGETVPAGITGLNTCYIRVTDGSESNTTDQKGIAFSFS